ncbi:hypothetical protein F4677DRAFT_451616 [Hypoxylon crocopeplum]|nr:hypothetical protein F4677DRAFT_451616 [Hypoxylon crocopeplum]
MEDKEFEIYEETDEISFTFNRKMKSDLWFEVVMQMQPFLRCQSGCFNDLTTSQPTQACESSTDRTLTPSRSKGINANSTTLVETASRGRSGNPLQSLPMELFLEIFSWVVGPYELEAQLTASQTDPYDFTLLTLPMPRTWRSMVIFHVCKAFRHAAIALYGQPCPDSLPFSPTLDKLVINELFMSDGRFEREYMERFREQPSPELGNGNQTWIIKNRRIHGKIPETRERTTSPKFRQPSHDFLQRIKCVDMTVLTKSIPPTSKGHNDQLYWGHLLSCLGATLSNVRVLRVSIWHYDDCGRKQNTTPSTYSYKARDAWFFGGFCLGYLLICPDDKKGPFPLLERFEVLKVGHKCSVSFEEHLRHGGWLFQLEEGQLAYIWENLYLPPFSSPYGELLAEHREVDGN